MSEAPNGGSETFLSQAVRCVLQRLFLAKDVNLYKNI